MRPYSIALHILGLALGLPFVYGQDAQSLGSSAADSPPPSQRELVDDAVKRLIDAGNWRDVLAIQKEFATLGEDAAHEVERPAKRHEDDEVRMRCFEVLTKYFGKQSEETIAHDGLSDPSEKIRYHCAWHVGDLKIYGSHRQLRRLMEDDKQPESVRNAATKSLAQLGEPDVIRGLVKLMADDYYMPRHMGNLGAKVLTGKDLNDFNGYEFSEGAFVSGGNELRTIYIPIDYHQKAAKRHQAIADYCQWLQKNRPEIFKHLYAPW
jgi:hypothetical protein